MNNHFLLFILRCSLLKDRKRLQDILHSHKFQTAIIVFVVLDFLIVLVQLLMDIQVIKGGEDLCLKVLFST